MYGSNSWASTTPTGDYTSEFTYDANGNLQTLKRNRTNGVLMDDLDYAYYSINGNRSNRLSHVIDPKGQQIPGVDFGLNPQSPGNYQYDEIGNLIADPSEEIDEIVWDMRGKIREVKYNSSSTKPDLEFRYDAMGNRTLKIVKEEFSTGLTWPALWKYTYYMRDAQGNIIATYEKRYIDAQNFSPGGPFDDLYTDWFAVQSDHVETLQLSELHIYGSDRLGMYTSSDTVFAAGGSFGPSGDSWGYDMLGLQPIFERPNRPDNLSTAMVDDHDPRYRTYNYGLKRYELKNHLGNVLQVISDRKLPDDPNGLQVSCFRADVYSYQDYYGFGMVMPGRNDKRAGYRFGFQG
jgi:hypothetical protein